MSTVLRLMLTYCFAVPWLRWFSLAGILMIGLGTAAVIAYPGAFSSDAWIFGGFAALFIGSAMMPLIFGTLVRSRQIHLLPFGRWKVLASAMLTTLLIALPMPISSLLALLNNLPARMLNAPFYAGGTLLDFLQSVLFWQIYVVTIFGCTWLYIALWFATSSRTAAGLMRSLLILIAVLVVPPAFVRISPDVSLVIPLTLTLMSWLAPTALLLFWPNLRRLFARITPHMPTARATAGKELDLFLGTSSPWLLALAQVLPVLLAARFIQTEGTWLFYLAIFSTVSGAIAGNAAARSRSIWLLASFSRAELFAEAERRFRRHNNYTLAAMLLLLIAICIYSELSWSLITWGAPLLILGTLASTYLGLMMTQGLRWREVPLASGVMLILMAAAILIAREPTPVIAVAILEGALLIIAIFCRQVARARWTHLDWSQCRVNRATTGTPSF